METDLERVPLALTCGDPAGIGPDVVAGALAQDPLGGKDCILLGPEAWAKPLAAQFGIGYKAVGPADFEIKAGEPSVEGAAVALAALQAAALGCSDGSFRGTVTGPVSKHWLQKISFAHPGQTEFFAEAWGGEPSMAFVGQTLRVVLATWHIPLSQVSQALTAECMEQAVRRAHGLARDLGIADPRIGVCGLNPHAGEGGLLGSEEVTLLNPALSRLRKEFPGVSECLPGDTVFHRQKNGDFDVVVAAYHDQGLAAVKTLEFDTAVNVTLGLPYVRTSPDHGTAFSLAGENAADCGSLFAALELARRLTRRCV
ncbi:MAG: 4-hydroxythreonine-4-phosphate dehydrogenase PdxA [Verrucomicrobia bacterium]|nr:4-hydroxythreonine-4-phosphate dehydrogenase PdxA [Verrucomicrobiota bacterium]